MMQDSKVDPLTARSVLASALLGEDPPELPVAHLVHLAGLFGISDNRARVALSRMVAAGEAITDGSGRYRLAGHLLDRRGRQTDSRRGETRRRGTGRWRLVVVTTSGRSAEDRLARRRAPGPGPPGRAARRGVAAPRQHRPGPRSGRRSPTSRCSPPSPTATRSALAAGLWDLAGVGPAGPGAARPAGAACPTHGPADLAPGFELSAAVLRHLQADPLLPAELLPAGLARAGAAARLRRVGPAVPTWCSGPGAGRPEPASADAVVSSGTSIGGPIVTASHDARRTMTEANHEAAVRRPGGGDHRGGPRARDGATPSSWPGWGPTSRCATWATTWARVGYPLGTEDDLAETVRLVEAQGRTCLSAVVDVRDLDATARLRRRGARASLGSVDILVANAGISTLGSICTIGRRRVERDHRHQPHRGVQRHAGGRPAHAPADAGAGSSGSPR